MKPSNYNYFIIVLAIMFWHDQLFAQSVGIGTKSPDNSAILELHSASKGILLPKVALSSISDKTTVPTPANALLLYNTNANLPGGAGFYYNKGTAAAPQWVALASGTPAGQLQLPYKNVGNWQDTGFYVRNNSAQYPAVAIAANAPNGNGVIANTINGIGVLGNSNGPGIGVYAAGSETGTALKVYGKIRIEGNSPVAKGKVLTSDENGYATWQGAVAFSAHGIVYGGSENMDINESKLRFEKEVYDLGNNYNNASHANHSVFIAPENGIYHFDVKISWYGWGYVGFGSIRLYRSGNLEVDYNCIINDDLPSYAFSIDLKLDKGETVYVTGRRESPGELRLMNGECYFNGRLEIKL